MPIVAGVDAPLPWLVGPNSPITRRKSFALIVDAEGRTFYRDRFFKNALDFIWSCDVRQFHIQTDRAIYAVDLLQRETL